MCIYCDGSNAIIDSHENATTMRGAEQVGACVRARVLYNGTRHTYMQEEEEAAKERRARERALQLTATAACSVRSIRCTITKASQPALCSQPNSCCCCCCSVRTERACIDWMGLGDIFTSFLSSLFNFLLPHRKPAALWGFKEEEYLQRFLCVSRLASRIVVVVVVVCSSR